AANGSADNTRAVSFFRISASFCKFAKNIGQTPNQSPITPRKKNHFSEQISGKFWNFYFEK
ncbi:TPA: hypothetical protein ACKN24_002186, partial [Neisseria gonorrhoeae]